MKEVKVLPRYQCDFCTRRSVKHVIARHEKTCYLNPNRVCCMCEGSGKMDAGDGIHEVDCSYCEKAAQVLKEVTEYRAGLKKVDKVFEEITGDIEVPF